jgi:hypothetical protein
MKIILFLFSYNILLEEVDHLNKLLATFSKQVVESIILLLFLGEKSGSRKTNHFLSYEEMELKPI